MTRISCDVKKCMHNTEGGCSLSSIEVGTSDARVTEETRCESYSPAGNSARNSCGCNNACDISKIKCSAENCKYNGAGKCEAKNVEISTCKTGNCGDTECNTFVVE